MVKTLAFKGALFSLQTCSYGRIGAPGEALARQQANDFGCLSLGNEREVTASGEDAEER